MKWLLLVQVMAEHTQCGHSGSNGVIKSITEVYTHTVRTFRVMEWWSLSLRCTPTQCGHSGSNGVMKSITEVYTHTVRTFRVMEWWSLSLRCTPTQCGHSGWWSDEVYHWGVHPHSADIQGQMEWWSLSLRCTPTQCRLSGSNGVMKSITEVYTHTVRTFRVKWSDEVNHTLTQSLASDSVSDNCLKYLRT